jgi:GMP synthase-like glutamine amidotransferase
MPKCLVVQHVPPESAFAIADALRAAHVEVDIRRVFDGDEVPTDSADLDGLIVMGGPMSAQSDRSFPTRAAEIGLLADALDRGVPSLGVCLGAQLLAVAAGGSVSPGDGGLEVGWGPVDLESACAGDALFGGLPSRLTVMHWHGNTFTLPGGSERLMSNSNYANQAFRTGAAAWGVQFHLEVTRSAVEGFLAAFPGEAAGAVGGAAAIRSATPAAISEQCSSASPVWWWPERPIGISWIWRDETMPSAALFPARELGQNNLPMRQIRFIVGPWTSTPCSPRSPKPSTRSGSGPD